MSIFGRIKDLVNANINAMLDNAEDPEKMANEYLRQLQQQTYEVKTNVAGAMADETRLRQRMDEQVEEVEKWKRNAETALRKGDETLAREALNRKVQAQKLAEQYEAQYRQQAEQVTALQHGLRQLETRIAETQAKKELIIAKQNRAKTQRTIQQTMTSVGNITAMDKLGQLEDRVDDELAQAEAMAQLEGESLENRFRELEASSDVDAELEELKRSLGMSGSAGESPPPAGS